MSFIDDKEKMEDFYNLPKEEFLNSYSYLKEEDYDETVMKIDAKELIRRAEEKLKQNEEYEEEYKDYKVCYILRDTEEIRYSIIMASDGAEMVQIYLNEEINGVPDWAYNVDEDIFRELQEDNKVIEYMDMDTHHNMWLQIDEYYPEDIEYKKGVQEYLKYCKENEITKERIEKEAKTIDVPNIMRFYKDKTKNKDDRC